MKIFCTILCLSWALAGQALTFTNSVGVLYPTNLPPAVALSWNAETDVTVIGYNLYYGAGGSRAYTNVISISGITNTTCTVSNLVRGATYYFALTAVTASGLESDFSGEASYNVLPPPVPPATPGTTNRVAAIQFKRNLADPWVDSGATYAFSPLVAAQFFRLTIQ